MSRTGTRLCAACVAVLTAAVCLRGDDRTSRIDTQLAVQAALMSGKDHLKNGDFAGAVTVLEKQLGLINGNHEYLLALRDAYAGYVRQLQAASRTAEAKVYQGRLAILEPTAAELRQPREITPRAKTDQPGDGDPFDKNNSAHAKKAQAMIDQAEKAFEEKQYERAAELYASASQLDSSGVAECRERWAYCKLYAVARAINRGEASQAAALKDEIEQAVKMSPKLEGFAGNLRKRLEGQDAPAVNVKHTPRVNGGWARAETTNFRIFHAASEADADKIARIAEATRASMTRKWFGEDPADWTPRCDVYVHPTGNGYAKATGAPATAPGHSTIKQDNGRVLERRIDLRGDDPNMMVGVLPHETTHVVLAGRFGTHYVPRWADEGMAVLSEPRDRVEMHLKNLPKHQGEGTLFSVSELMRLSEYPEPRRIGPFYAQSVSLVDFLCKKKDPATFARFLREALDGNTESALRRHFGYASSADLEREWKQHAFGPGAVASRAEKKR